MHKRTLFILVCTNVFLFSIMFFVSISIMLIFIHFSNLIAENKRIIRDRPFRGDRLKLSDDCYNMLASTNCGPFEFEYASRVTTAFWPRQGRVGRVRRVAFSSKLRVRGRGGEKARRRLFGELSASFKVHKSVREIGSAAALIRGLK